MSSRKRVPIERVDGCVMRDHYGLARERLGQLAAQERHGVAVILHDIGGPQAPISSRCGCGGSRSCAGAPRARRRTRLPVAVKSVHSVVPRKRTPSITTSSRSRTCTCVPSPAVLHLGERVLEMPPVILMVPRHVDHRPAERLRRPAHAARLHVNVAREYHHVGAGVGRLQRSELEVQVGEDVQAHGRASYLASA